MEQEQFELPPPAVFDVNASINAKPVVPLQPPRVDSRRSLRNAFITIRTRAFALVIIVGLSVGALAGTILVQHTDTTVGAQGSAMRASEIATSADIAVTGITLPPPLRRVRRHRRTMPFYRLDQPYRVTVIH